MYKRIRRKPTTINRNKSTAGEPIETKIERMMENNEPIGGEVDLTYTERGEFKPGYDIRTDKAEIALEAVEHKNKTHLMKREERMAKNKEKKEGKENSEKKESGESEAKPDAGKGGNDATNT